MTISNKDIETLALRVNLDNVRSLLVLILYRLPTGSTCEFFEMLHSFTDMIDCYTHRQDVIFLGDLNIDVSSKSKTQEKTKLLAFCHTVGIEQQRRSSYRSAKRSSILGLG